MLIEQVKVDLQQPDILRKLHDLGSPFQYLVYLTPEQERETHARFQVIKNNIIQFSAENLANERSEELTCVRYTLSITPSHTNEKERENNP